MEFTIRLGSQSKFSNCPGPDDSSEGIYIHHSCNGGLTWEFLKHMPFNKYKMPSHIAITLPPASRRASCRFRIWQPKHFGQNRDVWAIDDFSINENLLNNIFLNFDDEAQVNRSLVYNQGSIGAYCSRNSTLKFPKGQFHGKENERGLETKPLAIGPSFMLQFELVIGCESILNSKDGKTEKVYLDYSHDHSPTWQLVQHSCLPPNSACAGIHTQGTMYDATEYKKWKRVTINLPQATWSTSTRFRLWQANITQVESWAVDNLYIGPICPYLCSGHGRCEEGFCRCDVGFYGTHCLPKKKMRTRIKVDMTTTDDLRKHGFDVSGGEIITSPNSGCDVMDSSGSIYFHEDGVRQLTTPVINTEIADHVQFMLKTGTIPTAKFSSPSTLRKMYYATGSSCGTVAKNNVSSVLMQFSNNGGITWHLLKEFAYETNSGTGFESLLLPEEAKTASTQIRWWQPEYDEKDRNPWAVDGISIGQRVSKSTIEGLINATEASTNNKEDSPGGIWAFSSTMETKPYCLSDGSAYVLEGHEPFRFAVTNELLLTSEDVIQFKISVGCTDTFSWISPVTLEYSLDCGVSWTLVQKRCYPGNPSCGIFTEDSRYYLGTSGQWTMVVLPVTPKMANSNITFRWSQHRSSSNDSSADGAFALKDIYVGKACPNWCNGRGICSMGNCICDFGNEGPACEPGLPNPSALKDTFDDDNSLSLSDLWVSAVGSRIGQDCGPISLGNALFFGQNGSREARTKSLDTRAVKNIHFLTRIGWINNAEDSDCFPPTHANESLILQYSLNGGLSWLPLRVVDYQIFQKHNFHKQSSEIGASSPVAYTISLPPAARSAGTSFRWWQPMGSQPSRNRATTHAPWALDNIYISAHHPSIPGGFWEDFEPINSSHWFMTVNGSVSRQCKGHGEQLFFEDGVETQFAETMDFRLNAGAFLQFDLIFGCRLKPLSRNVHKNIVENAHHSSHSTSQPHFAIAVEYSVDEGHTWQLIRKNCTPSNIGCSGNYHTNSQFDLKLRNDKWNRITLPLPTQVGPFTMRVRWSKKLSVNGPSVSWALDNIYLGNDCQWLCSGHGVCQNGQCKCDPGFSGPHCVVDTQLPREFQDTFDDKPEVDAELWPETYNGQTGSDCGVLVSGSALTFTAAGLRMAITRDLDLSQASYIQFTFKMGCSHMTSTRPVAKDMISSSANAIVVQFSNNGGITWQMIKEVPYRHVSFSKRYVLSLHELSTAFTNATRIRFWQPSSQELNEKGADENQSSYDSSWAIDSIFIGGQLLTPNVLYDSFEDDTQGVQAGAWLDWPGGVVQPYCNSSGKRQAMVFSNLHGEHTAYTRDVQVNSETTIQFDILVGCHLPPTATNPVRLEYSTNLGHTWKLVRENYPRESSSDMSNSITDDSDNPSDLPSIFYANAQNKWKRVTILLAGLGICGNIRFRWYQGYFTKDENPPHWGLDNVYIGPRCYSHCHGRGYCLNGIVCQCDDDYSGAECEQSTTTNPKFIREHFDYDKNTESRKSSAFPEEKWETVSGASVSRYCGILTTGPSLLFNQPGERLLTTRNLDLAASSNPNLQFHIRLGCPALSDSNETLNKSGTAFPVMLQYSINGGITWNTIEKLHFQEHRVNMQVTYVNLELPAESLTSATKLRWWQPSEEGQFSIDWAIDKIYVSGDLNGLSLLSDDFKAVPGVNWNSLFGSILEPVCGRAKEVLHFNDAQVNERYAITTDVRVNESSFMQFELSMECNDASQCFEIELHYSLDAGKTWYFVCDVCARADNKCPDIYERSVYASDIYYTFKRVSIMLPYYTQSRSTRFKWIQKKQSNKSETWALDAVYVGDECPGACNGRGRCLHRQCLCDDGWTEQDCSIPKSPLPVELRDKFASEPSRKRWAIAKGGAISNLCGSVGSGSALHFYGGCSRVLQTVPLDLRNALFISFDFQFGCISPPKDDIRVVLLQYSLNSGIQWTTLTELNYVQRKNKRTTVILLPPEALQIGVLVRWWQPKNINLAGGDWALDDVVIGGKTKPVTSFQDFVDGVFAEDTQWAGQVNIDRHPYCGSESSVAVGESTGTESAYLETVDIRSEIGYTLEFMIAVGCNDKSADIQSSTISLQYSMDYGMSWHLFHPVCLPRTNLAACFEIATGPVGPSSVYGPSRAWRRIVLPLFGKMLNNTLRFRWIQLAASSTTTEWGIQKVYVGPKCFNFCHAHGSCLSGKCNCDSGYGGDHCDTPLGGQKKTVRETFEDPELDTTSWSLVLGGNIQKPCQPLRGQRAMVFNSCSHRLLETVDMDLSNAKFVKYSVVIGGSSGQSGCMKPSSRSQNVYFQYSNDGGISWHLLRELDYSEYGESKHDYVTLPSNVRYSDWTTRFRWWQTDPWECREQSGFGYAKQPNVSFAIDNIFIGGSDINPDYFAETFEAGIEQSENVWFYSGGQVVTGFCGTVSRASMTWRTSQHDDNIDNINANQPGSIETRELIVGEDYIMQFKIIVGCGHGTWAFNRIPAIILEYSTDPASGIWTLLTPGCYLGKTIDEDCLPNDYHQASIFPSDVYNNWTTITIQLPEKVVSSETQFRWRENGHWSVGTSWAIDDIYVGESCPNACSGRGDCQRNGQCSCNGNAGGEDCSSLYGAKKPSGVYDTFNGPSPEKWKMISGGEIGVGCGNMFPWGQGKQLYFGRYGLRQAVTADLDLTSARKISFILRIGSMQNTSSCNMDLLADDVESKAVILQFSVNNGVYWEFMASHRPQDFVQPKRVTYDIPFRAQISGVQFRWWQPYHAGQGRDQWAMDNVEISTVPLPGRWPSHARMHG